MSPPPLSALVADAASAAHGEARRMAYGMLANSVEATKEASVQFAADARCVDVCLRGLEAGDEAIRVAAAKCVKAAAKRAPAFRGALAKKGGRLEELRNLIDWATTHLLSEARSRLYQRRF